MASESDVRRIALGLPGATERASYENQATFRTKARMFAMLTHDPRGLLVWLETKEERDSLVAAEPSKFSTSRHYAGQATMLIDLEAVTVAELTELITESWLLRAPERLTGDWSR